MAIRPERNRWKETALVKGRVKEYWNGRADSFRVQREAELKSGQHEVWEQELLSHLPQGDSLRILDVGCGCGFFSFLLAENGHRVTGIDRSSIVSSCVRFLAKEESSSGISGGNLTNG